MDHMTKFLMIAITSICVVLFISYEAKRFIKYLVEEDVRVICMIQSNIEHCGIFYKRDL